MEVRNFGRMTENDHIPVLGATIFYCSSCHHKINIKLLNKYGICWKSNKKVIHMDYLTNQDKDHLSAQLCNRCVVKLLQVVIRRIQPKYHDAAQKIIRWWKSVRYNPKSPFGRTHILLSALKYNSKDELTLPMKLLNYEHEGKKIGSMLKDPNFIPDTKSINLQISSLMDLVRAIEYFSTTS